MDATAAEHFADIVTHAESIFEHVEAEVDSTPERAILRVQATYGDYRIFVVELLSGDIRKYSSYYVLNDDYVIAGFDNSADPRALRLKYGSIDSTTAGQTIPHLHLNDKTELLLTEEIHFDAFLDWLREYLPPNMYSS